MKKIYLLLGLLLMNFYYSLAQCTLYNLTNSNSSLTANSATGVAIDPQGNKWVTSQNLIARFDGSAWQNYRNSTHPSIPNEDMRCIDISASGIVYVGHQMGFLRFNGTTWTNYPSGSNGLPVGFIQDVAVNNVTGDVWIASSNGLVRFDGSSFTLFNSANTGSVVFSTTTVRKVFVDKFGVLYAGIGSSVIRFDGTTWSNLNAPGIAAGVRAFAVNPVNNDLWVGFGNLSAGTCSPTVNEQAGIMKYDGSSWTDYSAEITGNRHVTALAVDKDEIVYVAINFNCNSTNYRRQFTFDGSTWTETNFMCQGILNKIVIDQCNNRWASMTLSSSPSWPGGLGLFGTNSMPPAANAGNDQTVCGASASLSGSVSNASGGEWTSSGTGSFSPDNEDLAAAYLASAADLSAGSVVLTLTTTGHGSCSAASDDITITFSAPPSADAGADKFSCGTVSVTLEGSFSNAGGILWTSSGTGTFDDDSDPETSYTPSAADISSGTVTLTITTTGNGTNCSAASDNMTLSLYPAPAANAGNDQTVCGASASLSGSVSNASGGEWTSSGTGSFSPDTEDLAATYLASAADLSAGSVVLTLTTTGHGSCNAASDDITITFSAPPSASAGADKTSCGTVSVVLEGSFSNAGGILWTSSGTGTFDDDSDPETSYTPSAADISSGTITLTITTTGNGTNCSAASDNMTLSLYPAPVANAGNDQTVCGSSASLSGSVSNASGGEWTSSGTGSFSPDNEDLAAAYLASAADLSAGSVVLTLTTTGHDGSCNAASDDLTITFSAPPSASAGADKTSCGTVSVVLEGSFSNAGGILWTSSGTGTFDDDSDPETSYTPSAADISSGTVTLTITTTGNGTNCSAASDNMTLSLYPAPVANAGNDQTVCGASASLSGSVSNASGGEWTSSGTGTFSPDNEDLAATYLASAADLSAGSVVLTLTTTGNGSCNAASDDVTITFSAPPSANAGADKFSCGTVSVTLEGSFSNAGGTLWTSSGTGTFDDDSDPETSYTPSAADISSGTVTLTITTTGNNSNCSAASDNMTLSLYPAPAANAGNDQTVCGSSASLSGSVSNASGGEWTSSGTGTFSPDNEDLAATYLASAADLSAGSVVLTLTTTGHGSCNAASDDLTITFSAPPSASAGADKTSCGTVSVTLEGSFSNAGGILWTSSGTGTFDDDSDPETSYTPSAADISSGTITLTITTTGNGTNCSAASDNMTLSLYPAPVANAGNDQTVCGASASLSGSVSNASGGEWTSSGTGSFSPDNEDLAAAYLASAADLSAGSVVLTLTTTGHGSCNAASDDVTITFDNCTGTFSAGKFSVDVYPNPASSVIFITSQDDAEWEVQIIDAQGILRKEGKLNSTSEINIHDLQPGVYMVKLSREGNVIIKKVVKN